MHDVVVGAGYGLAPGVAAALLSAVNALETSVEAAELSKADLASKVATKNSDLVALIEQIATIAKDLYNSSTVTDPMIAAAGLAIHDTEPTPIIPVQPLNLAATPSWDGSAALKWSRNGNPQGVTFLVEGSPDGTAWNVIHTTTRASVTLTGFTPGTSFKFRIRATKNDILTLPSNEAEIYPTFSSAQLSIAA